MQMDKRTAVVTGVGMGTGQLGVGIAKALAMEGNHLMLADLDPGVEEIAALLLKEFPDIEIRSYAGDLSQEADVEHLVNRTLESFGRLDILVNNAGGGIIRNFLEHDGASLRKTLERNLWTTLWCCHKALPRMVEQNHGRIVNIGADSLRTGIPMHAGYNAAKGGVVGLTVGLAKEFARYDITVNTVSPCVINTERHRASLKNDPSRAEAFLRVVPKGRGAEIKEIADLVCFLSRTDTRFITGQELSINGGSAMP